MNKKTKTMFVMQPGGFGYSAPLFSAYEFEDNSEHRSDRMPVADLEPLNLEQTDEIGDWAETVMSLPETFHRNVWKPLARRVQKIRSAA